MNEFFPGPKRFMTKDEHGNILSERVNDELDWTIKAVCKHCNETWMSDIESQHAKPAMEDLIVGKKLDIPLSQSQANSLALFAFKTAVICDYIRRKHEPFFLRSIRHRFRESLAIPPIVRMWMAGLLPMGKGDVITVYHEGQLSPTNRLKLYVCTYAVGHLVFQVVTQRQQGFTIFGPKSGQGHEYLAVPFWPASLLPDGFTWPAASVLRTIKGFEGFALRWTTLRVGSV